MSAAPEPAANQRPRRWPARLALAAMAAVGLALATAFAVYPVEYVRRALLWGNSDVDDQFRFSKREIAPAAPPREPPAAPDAQRVRAAFAAALPGAVMDDWLAEQGTLAFVVMQHGKMLHEAYFNGQAREMPVTSFSVAKSILATGVLCALDQGLIASLDDPVTRWLPELGARDSRFTRITLRHLLRMHSGIRYRETRFLNGDDAKTYYWPDLRALALRETRIEAPPGGDFLYNNYHPLLLGLVLERATKMPVAAWTSRCLWQPAGLGPGASWSLDGEATGFEKLESGVNARAIDFVRFGQLMLNGGVAEDGTRVLSEALVREATGTEGAVSLEHLRPGAYYQLFWWGQRRNGGNHDFSARGNHGQFIVVSPRNGVVIARFGTQYGVRPGEWVALLESVAEHLGASAASR
ncbi:serine hydrolase [uncultured Piscinibacter sp.]|uniref:serine hydrolase domain-containing protein n=1 Tax=uncultured Piscinibacter sp. TaxID=1131835 RepID=UPI002621CA8F|nr:serine hydrolase [uncultured Piscinibacter sp.]